MCSRNFRRGITRLLTDRVKAVLAKRFGRPAWILVVALVAGSLALARGKPGPPNPGQAPRVQHSQVQQMKGGQLPNTNRGLGQTLNRGPNLQPRRPGLFMRVRELPPAEQESALANDPRFQRLPPERQEKIRQALSHWNTLTPEKKEIVRQREEIFLSLSPEQRQELRIIFPRWRRLNPSRQQDLLQAFRHLRDLSPAERQRFLSSPEFEQRFSPEEREILVRLGRLLPG